MTVKCSVENTSLVVFAGVNMDSRFKGLLLFIISWEGWVRTVKMNNVLIDVTCGIAKKKHPRYCRVARTWI